MRLENLFCALARAVLISISGVLLISCSANHQSNNKVSFPLLNGCKQSVVSSLNEVKELIGYDFVYEILDFTVLLDSHPDVIGVVNMSSSSLGVEELQNIIDKPLLSLVIH